MPFQLQLVSQFWKLVSRTVVLSPLLAVSLTGAITSGASMPIAMKTNPDDRRAADQYRQQGLSLRRQGRFEEAIAALQQSVNLDPQNIDGRVILGWTQHLAKQPEAAASSLWEAIYRSPTALTAFNAIGIVYLVRGDLPQAVVLHSWAAILKDDNEIAHYNLSLAYQRLQQYDLAIAYAEKATQLEPSNPHPFIAVAIALWSAGDRDRARQVFRQAIAIDGRYGNADFLNFLSEAGFSPEQIQLAKQML
ncbi:MAG: tetratricopeptide repeat protein [Pseudanabaenaceae cyanobacterium bins.39]|nr:tetratricopeptide repeat protein [Pseudanabaenaceae cyanobacterium bins.39]